MEWILVMCTAAWGLCGHYRETPYPTEEACYRALDDLYKRKGEDSFKYLLCEPRKPGQKRPA
jgi:hypothetical protein